MLRFELYTCSKRIQVLCDTKYS